MKKIFVIFTLMALCAFAIFAQEGKKMKITIDGKVYTVKIDKNVTSDEILSKLPLELTVKNFGNHEFWGELPFKPKFDQNRTSKIKVAHVYYWDGWNAFVINYIDWNIEPYRVVHIGEIEDKSICDLLKNKKDGFKIKVE